ncbi:hypothetical protein DE146DRAFT_264409 [Phaeosphaeria sp. MPI-PUGE-AT-0046c]|nr:hypothetical protein DE146DRAFT_264409 [Phaeosphaeria sp. MPI-PUGE-AT-0046c]
MAPQFALVALLSLAATTNAQFRTSTSGSAFWTYTSRYAAIASPSVYTSRNGGVTTMTATDSYRTVKATVKPTATPTSTSTASYYYSDEVLTVYEYYGLNQVPLSEIEPDYYETRSSSFYNSRTASDYITPSTSFVMPVTMTAPASCPTQFTVTTTATVSIPSIVRSQITPTSTVDGGISTMGSYYTYSIKTWYLSAGAAPFESARDFTYSYYIKSCSTPPAARSTSGSNYYGGGSGSSGDDDDSSSSSRYCYSRYSYYCGTDLKTWIIIVATVIPGLFVLGFLESYFWFRRLMMGKSAMRCGTVCWILISLFVLCFTRMQDRRSPEDRKLLEEKWKSMGSGAAFKAWMKWGFRRGYPVEHLGQYSRTTVGVVPEGQPLHPAMAQAPPGFMPGPPPPGAPGQVYYYGPPPPGWVPTPDGQGFMPPQGYVYPQPQQGGYYAPHDVPKEGTTVTSSPVSQHPAMAQQAPVSPLGPSPVHPQPPQPVHHANGTALSPPPQGVVPPPPAQPASNVSEAPTNPASAPHPPATNNNPHNRDLYE